MNGKNARNQEMEHPFLELDKILITPSLERNFRRY